jgi:vanillate/3-O-methylgallate O-demethylase
MPRLDVEAHRHAWSQAIEADRAFYLERPAVFSPAAAAQDAANRSRMLWSWAPIWLPWEYTNWMQEGPSFHDTAGSKMERDWDDGSWADRCPK